MPSDGYRRYMSSALTKLFIPKQTSVVAREGKGGSGGAGAAVCHADCRGRKLVVVMAPHSMSYWSEDTRDTQTERVGEKETEAEAGVSDGLRVWRLPVVIEYLARHRCCCCRLHTSLSLHAGALARSRGTATLTWQRSRSRNRTRNRSSCQSQGKRCVQAHVCVCASMCCVCVCAWVFEF